ncbi:MAG: transcription antitermination factor NusB [Alphaproteobacteria bacterium]|nr:transcription antitermination factor NusB [Alphaproteobacteria bacterium]
MQQPDNTHGMTSQKVSLYRRHLARLAAAQGVFSLPFGEELHDAASLTELLLSHYQIEADAQKDKSQLHLIPDRRFLKKTLAGTIEHLETLDKLITNHLAKEWDVDTLDPVILSILRVGTYEMYYTEVPPKVVIDEYVEVTHHYFSEVECRLVNAVLDAMYKSGARDKI